MLDIAMFFSLAILAAAGLGLLPELFITTVVSAVEVVTKRKPR